MKNKVLIGGAAVLLLIAWVIFWGVRDERQTERQLEPVELKVLLTQSYQDYLTHGDVTNYGRSNFQVWLATNAPAHPGTARVQWVIDGG
jgi:hypothetical protein